MSLEQFLKYDPRRIVKAIILMERALLLLEKDGAHRAIKQKYERITIELDEIAKKYNIENEELDKEIKNTDKVPTDEIRLRAEKLMEREKWE